MTTSAVADRILAALGEALRRRAGALLEDVVDGYAAPLAPVDELLQPTDRGWPAAFDVDATPDPAWVGEATGTTVPRGLSVEDQRAYVRDRAAWRRGSPGAVKGAVGQVLSGPNRRVDLRERDGSPWGLGVTVWSAQVGELTDEQILEAAATQKPVGIVLTDVEVLEGATWDHIVAEHGTWDDVLTDFGAWDAPGPTEDTVRYHVPEEGTEI